MVPRCGSSKLTGNAGANVLTGGAGNDSLTGGGDADGLWGGTGADRFIYTVLNDSTPGLRDTIYDFSHSESDRIDLSAIDAIVGGKGGKNDAFTWGGADTPTANGVWYSESAGHTDVHADVNGDTIADLQITLVGTGLGLIAADFIL